MPRINGAFVIMFKQCFSLGRWRHGGALRCATLPLADLETIAEILRRRG